MLVAAYGLPTLSVLELSYWLEGTGLSYGVVRNTGLQKVKKQRGPVTPVVFSSARLWARTVSRFTGDVLAFVVDDPITLSREYGLPLVGGELVHDRFIAQTVKHSDLAKLLTVRKPQQIQVTRSPFNPVAKILKGYRSSVLAVLQTQFYRIKKTEGREDVVAAVRAWLPTREPISTLSGRLSRIVSERQANLVIGILKSPEFVKFRSAIQDVKANPKRINAVAKQHKISPFDIKYVLAERR